MIELTRQKQIIEQEKKLFQEKNKKLWDQSIAIHKEKDRIDALRQEIETRHREILDSINYAKRIQNALVTSKEYLTKYLSDFFIFWAPKNVVSGDFYWAKHLDKGLMIIVADCTGHGVPGAFMSLLGISFLNEITAHNPSIEPAELLEMLRIKVKVSLNQNDQFFGNKDGMDMSCILMNSEEKSILFAGANNPMWLFRNNEIEIFDATKNPIGVFRKEQNFIQMEVKIEEDDIVYLFSDGYADQFGGNSNSKFKRVNLKNTLLTVSQEKLKMESAGDIIETVFNEWKNNNAQTDDVIIMGIRI
jgi:serine phosphatase RsbU (regulator of sigma subunit)